MLYLLLALPHGAPYAILAVLGVLLLIVIVQIKAQHLKWIVSIAGLACMIISLILFFKRGNLDTTIESTVPVSTFILFGISILCFILNMFLVQSPISKNKNGRINMV